MKKMMLFTMMLMLAALAVLPLSAEQRFRTYTDRKYGYEFTYTDDFRRQPLQASSERSRFAVNNQFMLPVVVSYVFDNSEGLDLSDLPSDYMEKMESSLSGSSGFEILSTETVTLDDGTEAVLFIFHWIWADGVTSMENVCVSTLDDGKIITLAGISVTDFQTTQDMENICLTLRLD